MFLSVQKRFEIDIVQLYFKSAAIDIGFYERFWLSLYENMLSSQTSVKAF